MKRIILILVMIGLFGAMGVLYWNSLSLADEKPAPGVSEQTQPAAPAAAVPLRHRLRRRSSSRTRPGRIPGERRM